MTQKQEIEALAAELHNLAIIRRGRFDASDRDAMLLQQWAEQLTQIAAGVPEWQPIETAPLRQEVLITIGVLVGRGRQIASGRWSLEGRNMDGIPDGWMPLPDPLIAPPDRRTE